ncbi:hypothetical protein BKA63DRAFT_573482 [Paraphoma chrysanthemicola]|nr:hypothetical protein BKA63DRAFT_573482 [Paraphoma chrysanthemicola]
MPILEVIGGTAAVSQLLGQAITIIQKIQDARAKVHGASARIDGYRGQLDNLLSALRLVQDEPDLQTPAIENQIQVVISLGKVLQCQFNAFAVRLAQSKAKQYTHAFVSGDRDERDLENAMTQLDRAKADLTVQIVTAHVGLSGSMRTGFTAALAVVQRVDQNVQRVLDKRLLMAAQLEEHRLDEGGNGTVPLTAEDVGALGLVDKVSWIDNKAFDDADIFQTDLVERQIHLKTLIRHVEHGGQLTSHDDVPEDVRQQLYAEEQQQLERHRGAGHSAPTAQAPIHITNVLPGPSHPTSGQTEVQAKPRLDVPGFLDAAVEEYSDWQQSRVRREDQKEDIRKLCDMALEHRLDLQQLFNDQDPDFFISRGIKLGVARRFIGDIPYWVQQQMGVNSRTNID